MRCSCRSLTVTRPVIKPNLITATPSPFLSLLLKSISSPALPRPPFVLSSLAPLSSSLSCSASFSFLPHKHLICSPVPLLSFLRIFVISILFCVIFFLQTISSLSRYPFVQSSASPNSLFFVVIFPFIWFPAFPLSIFFLVSASKAPHLPLLCRSLFVNRPSLLNFRSCYLFLPYRFSFLYAFFFSFPQNTLSTSILSSPFCALSLPPFFHLFIFCHLFLHISEFILFLTKTSHLSTSFLALLF